LTGARWVWGGAHPERVWRAPSPQAARAAFSDSPTPSTQTPPLLGFRVPSSAGEASDYHLHREGGKEFLLNPYGPWLKLVVGDLAGARSIPTGPRGTRRDPTESPRVLAQAGGWGPRWRSIHPDAGSKRDQEGSGGIPQNPHGSWLKLVVGDLAGARSIPTTDRQTDRQTDKQFE
jgi:hypothetical protein